ncbi:unnamed protein product, partial [Pylaiella littoralis]
WRCGTALGVLGPSQARVEAKVSSKFVAVQDLDDEMESDILVLEGVESLGNATDSIGENQEAHAAMVRGMVDQQTSQIRDAADVTQPLARL